MYNVAVDVGGTFTDVLVFDEETGRLTEGKVLSTPEDPSKGVVDGIEAVCQKIGITFPVLGPPARSTAGWPSRNPIRRPTRQTP
jgi:predicted NBD/HSP70 family sugar kinase